MSNGFVNVLDKIGDALKWFFTNKTAEDIENVGLSIAEVALPGVAPLLTGIQKSIVTAQGLAASAPSGLSTAAMTALVVSDAQAAFAAYEQQTGKQIETAQQQQIITLFIQLLQNIPAAAPVSTPTTAAPAAPPVQTQVKSNELI